MRSILVSEPVWLAIAKLGKFGETEDDVLRRAFTLPPATSPAQASPARPEASTSVSRNSKGQRQSFATDRMSSYISHNELRVSFASGPESSWKLPVKSDKAALRLVRDQATSFAKKHGATIGQVNAVRKTLTDAGYYLLK